MKSRMPVARLIQKAAHMMRNSGRNGPIGMLRAMPSSRRSTTQAQPTSSIIPNVWTVSTVGNAQTVSASRSQVEKALSYSAVRYSVMTMNADYLYISTEVSARGGQREFAVPAAFTFGGTGNTR